MTNPTDFRPVSSAQTIEDMPSEEKLSPDEIAARYGLKIDEHGRVSLVGQSRYWDPAMVLSGSQMKGMTPKLQQSYLRYLFDTDPNFFSSGVADGLLNWEDSGLDKALSGVNVDMLPQAQRQQIFDALVNTERKAGGVLGPVVQFIDDKGWTLILAAIAGLSAAGVGSGGAAAQAGGGGTTAGAPASGGTGGFVGPPAPATAGGGATSAGVGAGGASTVPVSTAGPATTAATELTPINMASLPSRISTTTARGGLFRKVGNFFGQNPIVGNVIEGIGSGLLNLAASRDQLNAQRDLEAQRQEQIRQNYQGTNPGQTFSDVGRRPGLSPVDRFSPDYYGRLRYRYDPRSRTIVEETEGG